MDEKELLQINVAICFIPTPSLTLERGFYVVFAEKGNIKRKKWLYNKSCVAGVRHHKIYYRTKEKRLSVCSTFLKKLLVDSFF